MTDEERKNVLAFAIECIEVAFQGGDLGGADIQDAAVKYGLLVEAKFDPQLDHDPDGCAGPGATWYRMAEFMIAEARS